jgi:class 3 adenylate cyclase
VRIGIHAGEPVADHNDLFGTTGQLAHRLCSEAEADGVIVSGLVRELSDEHKTRFVALGDRRLKGFTERTPVFRFEWRECKSELSDGAVVDPKRAARRAKY